MQLAPGDVDTEERLGNSEKTPGVILILAVHIVIKELSRIRQDSFVFHDGPHVGLGNHIIVL